MHYRPWRYSTRCRLRAFYRCSRNKAQQSFIYFPHTVHTVHTSRLQTPLCEASYTNRKASLQLELYHSGEGTGHNTMHYALVYDLASTFIEQSRHLLGCPHTTRRPELGTRVYYELHLAPRSKCLKIR